MDSRNKGLIIVSIVVILAFILYEMKEFSTPLLYGIDGPYYYVQVNSILKKGTLLYQDPPLAFYILTGFSLLLGDVMTGVKVGSIFVTLLGAFAIYYLVSEMTNEVGGVAGSIFYVANPWMVRMSMDLIKNAMGLTFLSFTLLFAYLSVKRRDYRLSLLSSLFIILTGLTHVLDFGVALSILFLVFLLHIKDRESLKMISLPLIAALALLTLGFTTNIMGGDPYKGVAFLQELIAGKPRFMAKPPVKPMKGGQRGLLDIIYSITIALAGLILSIKSSRLTKEFLFSSSLILIVLAFPLNPGNFLWRFDLMTAVLAPLILGIVIGEISDPKTAVVVALIIFGLLLPLVVSQAFAIRPSIPLGEYRELEDLVYRLEGRYTLVVPSPKLLYWAQAVDLNAVRSPKDVNGSQIVIVVDRGSPRVPMPPGRPIYRGRFIDAYLIARRH